MISGIAEDKQDGLLMLRVYVGPRYRRLYVLIEDAAAADEVRRAWGRGGHVWLDEAPPPSVIWHEDERP